MKNYIRKIKEYEEGGNMQKQDIVLRLKKHARGAEFITKKQIADTFGMIKQEHVKRYIKGLQAIDGKYYDILEVAGELQRRLQ